MSRELPLTVPGGGGCHFAKFSASSVAVLAEDVACSVAVLCSSGPVPCSVAADDVDADHTGGGGATTCPAVGLPGGGGGGSPASLDMNECEMFDLWTTAMSEH